MLPADQVVQHPLGMGDGGRRTHQMASVIRVPVTHSQLLVKLDSAEAKRSLKAEALLIKELYKA